MHEGHYNTFRAQLALPEQRHLFDYWLNAANGRAMPSRADISPAGMSSFLPHVSLIEVRRDPVDFYYRLAGTRLRDYFAAEVTGLCISGFSKEQNGEYWQSALERIAITGRPGQGVLRGPEESRDHLVQFWMRLPLGSDDGSVNMILGHDVCVPASRSGPAQDLLAATADN